jgi:hypothetical protein
MTEQARLRLRRLLAEFRAGVLDTERFCAQFEHTYNLELDKSTLTPDEAVAFGALFEQVVWYSPFREERARIPNYRSEADIARAADAAAHCLGTDLSS